MRINVYNDKKNNKKINVSIMQALHYLRNLLNVKSFWKIAYYWRN